MSQSAARHDPYARPGDEDEAQAEARQRAHKQYPRSQRPVGRPADDGGVSPDEPDDPDEGEFELIGDNDLGAADLGPAAPNAPDPDAPSGRVRKMNR